MNVQIINGEIVVNGPDDHQDKIQIGEELHVTVLDQIPYWIEDDMLKACQWEIDNITLDRPPVINVDYVPVIINFGDKDVVYIICKSSYGNITVGENYVVYRDFQGEEQSFIYHEGKLYFYHLFDDYSEGCEVIIKCEDNPTPLEVFNRIKGTFA